ncbi:MAG: hypothetical protein WAU70_17585, partial [Flavobacteriales bacterium]
MFSSNIFSPLRLRYFWRRYMGARTALVITSVIIGLCSSLCAVALKKGIHTLTGFANQVLFTDDRAYLVLVIPCVGILLSVAYTHFFLHGDLGRGMGNLLK